MEGLEKAPEHSKEKEELEKIRAKIKELVEVEKAKKAKNDPEYNATLVDVDPDSLEDEDLIIFKHFLDRTLSQEIFGKYKEDNDFYGSEDEKVKRRGYLQAYLNNALMHPENSEWYGKEKY
jgi:hypothetical protein